MKKSIIYRFSLLVISVASLASCSEDMEYPPMVVPEATIKVNTTLADFKAEYWSTERNYCKTVGLAANEADMVIGGRVISSDASGNIFKNIVICDSTAALTVAINAYSLYESYQYGQEVVINVSGMSVGGYNGLMQLGAASEYNGSPSMTFMEKTVMDEHAQVNGLASTSLIDTVLTNIPELTAAKSTTAGLQKWQSRLVRLDGVTFVNAGQQFANGSNQNRYVKDAAGQQLNVRCSSYADFAKDIIPSGSGSVVGILSTFGTDWQLLMIDSASLIGFNN